MRDVLASLEAWTAEGRGAARAVVVRTYGSAPRREGAVMLLSDDGRVAGSVSGGCVEGATVGYLEEARDSGSQRLVRFGVTDEQAWEVGLACGGTIDVLVQPTVPAEILAAARAVTQDAAAESTHGRAVITQLPGAPPDAEAHGLQAGPAEPMSEPLIVHDDGRVEGELADATGSGAADDLSTARVIAAAREATLRGLSTVLELPDRQLFIEVFPVRPRLVIVGGVPVAQALARLARELGYEVIVIDGRPAFATPERFPAVDRLIVGWPDEVVGQISLGPADAVAVLSHDPKFDEPAVIEALRRDCRYVGAIGSRTTQAARRTRLLDAGITGSQLDRLRGPIGLDLGGRTPAETALAIMAEVVSARYEASARPMSERPTVPAD
jgi:xanthine dehydrogenase accessory factor